MEEYFESRHSFGFGANCHSLLCQNIEVNWGSLRSQITTEYKEVYILVLMFSFQALVKIPLNV